MKKILLSSFIILSSYLQAAPIQDDVACQITYQPRANESYRMEQTINSHSSYGEKFQNQYINRSKMCFKVDVTNVDEEQNATLNVAIVHYSVKTKANEGEFVFDSDKSPSEATSMHRALARLIGKSYSITYSPTKGLIKVNNLDAIYKDMVSEFDDMDEETKKNLTKTMQNLFGEEAIKNAVNTFGFTTPKAVKVGESWKQSFAYPPFQYKVNLTLMELKEDKAIIKQEGKIRSDRRFIQDYMGIKMKTECKGTISCTYHIDPTNGWMLSAKWVQKVKGKYIALPSENYAKKSMTPFKASTITILKSEKLVP